MLNSLKTKAKAFNSSQTDDDLDASSRVSARERLQLLGIGVGTLTRFPVQSLPESRPDIEQSEPSHKFRDIGDMYLFPEDRTGQWESDLEELSSDEKKPTRNQAESYPHINLSSTTPPESKRSESVHIIRRRLANAQLKHFHIYSVSLVAVVVCSVWMFAYAVFF